MGHALKRSVKKADPNFPILIHMMQGETCHVCLGRMPQTAKQEQLFSPTGYITFCLVPNKYDNVDSINDT